MSIKKYAETWAFDPRNVRQLGDLTVVTTSCLYPSMSAVTVVVEGGSDTLLVHDNGQALLEASGAGAKLSRPDSILRTVARQYGLKVTDQGRITTPRMSPSDIGAGIVMVANASKEAVSALLARYRPFAPRDTKEVVGNILLRRFAEPRIHVDRYVTGASSKQHRFDFAVDMDNGGQLLLDIVLPDASSINSAVVASIDVSQRPDAAAKSVQRIVYDESLAWKPQDISLLGVSGRPVQLSALSQTIDRLATRTAH